MNVQLNSYLNNECICEAFKISIMGDSICDRPMVYLPATVDGAACKLFASSKGGTSLSSTSDQTFVAVPASKYEAVKEVRLRLVCADPKKVRPSLE